MQLAAGEMIFEGHDNIDDQPRYDYNDRPDWQEDEDSNDEDNWRNEYPDEEDKRYLFVNLNIFQYFPKLAMKAAITIVSTMRSVTMIITMRMMPRATSLTLITETELFTEK